MNKDRNTTSLGWNTATDCIDLVNVDAEGNVSFLAALCPAHPVAIRAVIQGLEEVLSHVEAEFNKVDNPTKQ